jgi:hypothetical protein
MKLRLLALTLSSGLSVSALVAAQPARPGAQGAPVAATPPAIPSLSETLTGQAKEEYLAGRTIFVDQNYAGALVKFASAYELSKDARLKWNMAACEKNLAHYTRVRRLVQEYVAEGGDKLTAEDKTEARDLLNAIAPYIGRLRLVTSEAGALVFLDGVEIGKTPLLDAVEVDVGIHKVRVVKADYTEFATDITVSGASDSVIQAQISRIVHEGDLVVRAPENAAIILDGQLVGKEIYRTKIASGVHPLKVTKAEFLTYQTDVIVQDNKVRTVDVVLQPEPKKGIPTWAIIVIGGVGLAAIGGVVTAYALREPEPIKPAGTLEPGNVSVRFW